jgi:excisionase family DNA binding protein
VPERIALTVDQAAEIIGCSRPTIYAAIKRGDLRKFKIGRLTRIPAADVYALIGFDAPIAHAGDAA